MLYRIAVLINSEYIWVSNYVTTEEAIPHLYRVLNAAYEHATFRTFEGYDEIQVATALLTASAHEREKHSNPNFLDVRRGELEKGPGGDHDSPYRYCSPGWGRPEQHWCTLLGQVMRGEWGEDPKNRVIAQKKTLWSR